MICDRLVLIKLMSLFYHKTRKNNKNRSRAIVNDWEDGQLVLVLTNDEMGHSRQVDGKGCQFLVSFFAKLWYN